MPQCAVIGLPGQIGQTSPAAWSQTVNTKSIFGAPGLANSSQHFERSLSAGSFIELRVSIETGFTSPLGKLPALYA